MSENSTPEERTELPTDRRMGEIRKQGGLHMSNDVVQVATLLAGFLALSYTWQGLFSTLKLVLVKSYSLAGEHEPLTLKLLHDGFTGLLLLVGPQLLTILAVTAVVAIFSVMLQTRWNVKEKKIEIKFSQLNPVNGLKRIFSLQGVISTIKALLKLGIILPMGFFGLQKLAPVMITLPFMSLDGVFNFTGTALTGLFWKIMYVLISLAIFDFVYGRFRWLRDNKMTKDEVKDERKAVEGDETTKRKIIAKGLSRMAQRISKTVPKADVVITNPTHFAVALKYDKGKSSAPIVVAKGQDYLALRIREIAKESGVPILERKALARALYSSTKVGAEIPRELFKAVAEVLAYVYRIKRPKQASNG